MLQKLLRKNKYAKDITHRITSAYILDNFFSTINALRLISGVYNYQQIWDIFTSSDLVIDWLVI